MALLSSDKVERRQMVSGRDFTAVSPQAVRPLVCVMFSADDTKRTDIEWQFESPISALI
jgi:hypothetical protein